MADEDRELCGESTENTDSCGNYADTCPWHSGDEMPDTGRKTKFGDVKDDLLDAADSFLNHKQIANKGGVARSTLYLYLDEHDEFSDSFMRARGDAASRLISRGLDDDDEIDMKFVQFLLERSFKFIKTERQEIEHSGDLQFEVSIGGDDY